MAEGPAPVGQYKPNAFGVYDMSGNVAEWVGDWFDRAYYQQGPEKNPAGPESGKYKMIRGGAWSDGPRQRHGVLPQLGSAESNHTEHRLSLREIEMKTLEGIYPIRTLGERKRISIRVQREEPLLRWYIAVLLFSSY